jgi:hypothetical protein
MDLEVGARLGVHFARGCSRLLGGARLCSLLLSAGLHRLAKPQVGGVVVTILPSEGPLVEPSCAHSQVSALLVSSGEGLAAGEH